MLKIVPDPPHYANLSLEDILIQVSEYLVCALTVTQQAILTPAKPPQQVLSMAAMHEIEHARNLVEVALSKVQVRH